MQELIGRISANVGIDRELAAKAVSIILNFLNDAAPPDKMAKLLESLPDARDVITSDGGGGGTMGGMMGAMAAMNALTETGLGMAQVQGVTKETIAYVKEKAGADTVDEIVAAIPGLSQFV